MNVDQSFFEVINSLLFIQESVIARPRERFIDIVRNARRQHELDSNTRRDSSNFEVVEAQINERERERERDRSRERERERGRERGQNERDSREEMNEERNREKVISVIEQMINSIDISGVGLFEVFQM